MSTISLDAETLWVETPQVRLHVRRARPRGGAATGSVPVLFVHGYPDSWRSWIPAMEALGTDHEVAAFDLRGAGRSSAPDDPEGFAIERVLPDFIAVIDAIAGPQGQVHLVSHDWGAVLSWALANVPAHAARLRSLTAIAGPHPHLILPLLGRRLRSGRPRDLRFVADQLRRSWYILAFQIPGLAERLWRRDPVGRSIRAHRAGGVPRATVRECVDPETVLADTIGPLGLYRQLLRGALRRRRPPTLSRIDVPSLMVVPRRDFALSPLLYDSLGDHVSDLEMRYIDANHWVHHQHPELVHGLLRAHLRRNRG